MCLIMSRKGEFVHFEEGTGDNLLKEDIREGYVDYLNWTKFVFDAEEFREEDGGMILYKEPVKDVFKRLADAIPDVLRDVYGDTWDLLCKDRILLVEE